MADFRSRIMMSSGHRAVRGGPAGKVAPSSIVSGSTNWDSNTGMDGITVVRIDDTHIAEEQSNVVGKVREGATAYYEMEYSMPADDEIAVEEDDDGVYVIEYSNPEEEGQSYQFTMSVDRSLPPKKPIIKHPTVRESTRAPLPVRIAPRPPLPVNPISTQPQRMMPMKRRLIEEDVKKEEIVSNKCVLELGEDYNDMMKMNDGKSLVCSLCPPPGRRFKKAAGLAVHLKSTHQLEGRKTFFCTWCQLPVRSQILLDTHTKRHVNAETVFTCKICPEKSENNPEVEEKGFRGSKWVMKKHMEKEHPGIIPSCDFCSKNFKTVDSYLADQFKHIGVTPHYCAKCKIYEITERGLSVHIKNHDKPKKGMPEPGETPPLTPSVPAATADNSATDDSDF
ncbi:protein krueppel-like isoform X2 [Cheilinus undulatus]|uniref:protein krueppel-like isoform X2 n=1 Tax=Cheilinus undulatus TaxID=241271 RepID=UPI001BD36E7D|nr:protein krueppel-like isoform X2 [Cheilinus undulatus]